MNLGSKNVGKGRGGISQNNRARARIMTGCVECKGKEGGGSVCSSV